MHQTATKNREFKPASVNYMLAGFFIAQDIAQSMSKDMERMMNLMIKSILEGMSYERK